MVMSFWRYLVLGFVVAVAPATVWSQKITKETTVSEGRKRTYYIYVPRSLTSNSSAPLIVLLHGSGHVGLSLAEKWNKLAEQEGAVIVAPDSFNSSVWATPVDGPEFLHELIESIKIKYPINPRRVYLFGHSGGAGFALIMSLFESEYFAATAIHAGALLPSSTPLIAKAKRKTPIQIQVGTIDPFFPLSAVRSTRDQLNSRGFSVQLIEIPGHNHWYYDLAAKINQAAWDFLKTHELPGDPHFEEHHFKGSEEALKKVTEQYNRGVKLQQAGDLKGAIAAYTRVVELDPNFADAYNNRGAAYVSLNDVAAAIQDFTRSLAISPSPNPYNNRGAIYVSQQKYEEAITDLNAGINLQPSADAYANRGIAYMNTSRLELARDDFEKAIGLDAKFGRAYVLRGLLLLKMSSTMDAAAWKDLDQGFQLDPSLHEEFDPMIKQLRPNQ
jgi:poly(3-hydroxybutyrate) depolymerase/lipoprotein NlpI